MMTMFVMTSLLTADCSTFLPLQCRMLDRQWCVQTCWRYGKCRGWQWKLTSLSSRKVSVAMQPCYTLKITIVLSTTEYQEYLNAFKNCKSKLYKRTSLPHQLMSDKKKASRNSEITHIANVIRW